MENSNVKAEISKLIAEKLTVKREVFKQTKAVFSLLREVLQEMKNDLQSENKLEKPIDIRVVEVGEYEIRFRVGGETILFIMHSNVFDFDEKHKVYGNSYVQKGPYKTFCGQIYMYNFLSDSFKYNRYNDLGYLIARLFVNIDKHFFVEGKERLSFLFNDFNNAVLTKGDLTRIVEEVVHNCLTFDLNTPAFKQVEVVTVDEISQVSNELKLQTGKRLGFRFKSDEEMR